jgi:hypothetical protein
MRPNRFKFLIDKTIQLELVFYIVFISFFSILGVAYMINSGITVMLDSLSSDPMLTGNPALLTITEMRTEIFYFGLAGILVGMAGSVAFGILISHRIAGPIFVLKRSLQKTLETGVLEPVRIRKADFAHELIEAYNKVVEKVNSK